MIKLQVDALVIEVTRRCNMRCEHCIRGDAQDLDISEDILEMAAKHIHPMSVTFSGGEPSLNVPAITKYFELARRYGTMPMHFYVVTNGKTNQMQLATALLHAYPEMEEAEMCGLALSDDIFHEGVEQEAIRTFEALSFFKPNDKKHSLDERDPAWVIDTGRAFANGIGRRPPEESISQFNDLIQDCNVEDSSEDIVLSVEELYLSANGGIVSLCDISYEDMDEEKICSISELPALMDAYAKSSVSLKK